MTLCSGIDTSRCYESGNNLEYCDTWSAFENMALEQLNIDPKNHGVRYSGDNSRRSYELTQVLVDKFRQDSQSCSKIRMLSVSACEGSEPHFLGTNNCKEN